MVERIRMNPETMRKRAEQYRQEAEAVNNIINRMNSLMDSLQSEWDGAAKEAYTEKYLELRPGFIKAEELINEIANALDTSVNALESADSGIAVKISI